MDPKGKSEGRSSSAAPIRQLLPPGSWRSGDRPPELPAMVFRAHIARGVAGLFPATSGDEGNAVRGRLDRDADWIGQSHHALHGVDRLARVSVLNAQLPGRLNRRIGLHDINSDLSSLEGDYVFADQAEPTGKAPGGRTDESAPRSRLHRPLPGPPHGAREAGWFRAAAGSRSAMPIFEWLAGRRGERATLMPAA
jgi:hypothetical protein